MFNGLLCSKGITFKILLIVYGIGADYEWIFTNAFSINVMSWVSFIPTQFI